MLIAGGCYGVVEYKEDALSANTDIAAISTEIRPALLRLEDIGPGGQYQGEESLEKLKVVTEYLHQEEIPFQVSIIPRMVVPQKGYDVSITDQDPYAKKFLSSIKDMEKIGGIMGIHGYTHQSAGEASGIGFEFYDKDKNPGVPDTVQFARGRISRAIDLFEKAGIVPAYWETPHYTAGKQYQAFEEQIGLIYENNYRGINLIKPKTVDFSGKGYRGYSSIPTPLGYVTNDIDMGKMINLLDPSRGNLASFFYHPFKEFKFITLTKNEKGEPLYIYDQNSPLHVLVRSFKEKGYTFVSIYNIARFVPAHRLEFLPFREGDGVYTGYFEQKDKKSILVWNKAGGRWHMYRYTPTWYAPRRVKAFEDLGVWLDNWPSGIDSVPLIGNFTGDQLDDLLVYSPGSDSFYLSENRGSRLLPVKKGLLSGLGLKALKPMAGDYNGDGWADLALLDRENGRLGLALNTGLAFSGIAWQNQNLLKEESNNYLPGDFNGDGKSDIAVLNTVTGRWNVLLAGSQGTLGQDDSPWLDGWGAGDTWKTLASDINGDGKDDLVLYNREGYWQLAISSGKRFLYKGEFGPWGAGHRAVPQIGDLSGDKRSDLIIIEGAGDKGYNLDTALSVMGR
ncbi:MAG: DUF2334 domain-containing protein [Desulfocucumaceae bacterium]